MANQKLASAVRNGTIALDPGIKSPGKRGLMVCLNVTAVPGVDTVQVAIYRKFLAGEFQVLAAAARAGAGSDILTLYPGITVAANLALNDVLPDQYRIYVLHSAGTAFTYSVETYELD